MKRLAFALILSLSAATQSLAASPMPRDFAYGQVLTVKEKEPLHELSVPLDAYIWSRQPNLADLRVFNNDGGLVPAALLLPPAPQTAPVATRPLHLFPVAAESVRAAGGMTLRARTDRTGAIINLDTTPASAGGTMPTVYIVDATSLQQHVAGMELSWNVPSRNYLGTVTIAMSDDLQNWRPLATGPVTSLRQGNESLEQRTVEFTPVRPKYFRITLAPEQDSPRLTGASARLAASAVEPSRQWRSLATVPGKERAGDYHFDTGGKLPIDRLRVRFPEANTLVRACIYSRPNDKSPWALRQSALLYQLNRVSAELASPAVVFPPCTDRYWVMRVEQNGGIGTGLPQMEVGWIPHRLVFLARGPAPYLLAYGSGRDDLAPLRGDSLVTELHAGQRDRLKPALASAGPRQELGGREALRPRIPPTTWRKVLLWGVLVLGVALLAWMAWRLQREMGGKEAPQ